MIDKLPSADTVKRFIKFPSDIAEVRLNQPEFYAVAQFLGVVGVIDGTHIQNTNSQRK